MKPILFNTEMVRAILAGDKTQTRRIIKPQPEGVFKHFQGINYVDHAFFMSEKIDHLIKCPFKMCNNLLWVRETFHKHKTGIFSYKADHTIIENAKIWKPSIHMPKEACRLFLKILIVKVERLQDISDYDAIKEGVKFDKESGYYFVGNDIMSSCPVNAFRELWIKTYGFDSWESNPFVWVVEFSPNFDRIGFFK